MPTLLASILILTPCFSFFTSIIFCQTPNSQNIQIHLKNYYNNFSPWSSIIDGNQNVANETEIPIAISLIHTGTHYYNWSTMGQLYPTAQNKLNKTIVFAKSRVWLEGSLQSLGFRSSGSSKPIAGGTL